MCSYNTKSLKISTICSCCFLVKVTINCHYLLFENTFKKQVYHFSQIKKDSVQDLTKPNFPFAKISHHNNPPSPSLRHTSLKHHIKTVRTLRGTHSKPGQRVCKANEQVLGLLTAWDGVKDTNLTTPWISLMTQFCCLA